MEKIREIARILNISRNTVKRYKRMTTYVETVAKWDKRGV
jgi:DNA-binding CsgD family transcriptional regulator